jgi:4-aminobutyrate aminotransferase/(S)-3-amino-2-methylpropionate transaminase
VEELGQREPAVRRPLPGPAAARLVEVLARTECPSFTTRRARRSERAGAPHDPIVWAEARGVNVVDTDGNRFVDLTAGFGVAAIGHAHPRVVAAIASQSQRLLHALGDLHPSDVKVALLERLAALSPWNDARVVLGLSGADAVEAALKTAVLATHRPGVLAFEGGYHGLSHGPLAACGFAEAFRAPFAAQLNPHVTFAPYPRRDTRVEDALAAIERVWPDDPPGAILVEPLLGRGGVVLPPDGFVRALGTFAHAHGALLIVDEIFTGFGRTGARFRSLADGAEPDLICVGKALGGGLPTSALLGRGDVMSAWGDPDGAAIHTGTFFGNPLGCAAAHAALDVIEEEDLGGRATRVGGALLAKLEELAARHPTVTDVRGLGLAIGVELASSDVTLRLVRQLLEVGYLVLPAGADASVLQIVPPLIIEPPLLDSFVAALDAALGAVSA